MQDIEFTIQQGKLYMLQTRNGKRTAPAALKIAVDMAQEGLISKSQAILSLKPDLVDQLLHPTLDPKAKKEVIAKGLPASPGAAGGKVAVLEYCRFPLLQLGPSRKLWRRIDPSPLFTDVICLVFFRLSSLLTKRCDGARMVRRSSLFASRPARTTSTACTQRRES